VVCFLFGFKPYWYKEIKLNVKLDEKLIYVGESNENHITEIKIQNIMPLSCKLADVLPML
jgi:hypothetical protein